MKRYTYLYHVCNYYTIKAQIPQRHKKPCCHGTTAWKRLRQKQAFVQQQERCNTLKEFDELVKNQKPNIDKAKILNSPYYQSLLRVSWNLIEAEILHCPDSFDMRYDIQQYYALHQSLTLEDLARANSRHTLNGLMRVVSKV